MGTTERDRVPAGNDTLTRLFHALANRTRRRLLTRLIVGSANVTDLARPFRMSLPAVSKHLRILERAGLISRTVDGRVHRLALRGRPLRQVEVWLDPFRAYWEGTLDALRTDLARHPPVPRRTEPPSLGRRPRREGATVPSRAGSVGRPRLNREHSG